MNMFVDFASAVPFVDRAVDRAPRTLAPTAVKRPGGALSIDGYTLAHDSAPGWDTMI